MASWTGMDRGQMKKEGKTKSDCTLLIHTHTHTVKCDGWVIWTHRFGSKDRRSRPLRELWGSLSVPFSEWGDVLYCQQDKSHEVNTNNHRQAMRGELTRGEQEYVPVKVIDLVGVLSLLSVLLIRPILNNLHTFTSTRLILAGLCYGVQLTHLVLEGRWADQNACSHLNLKYWVCNASERPFCIAVLCNGSCVDSWIWAVLIVNVTEVPERSFPLLLSSPKYHQKWRKEGKKMSFSVSFQPGRQISATCRLSCLSLCFPAFSKRFIRLMTLTSIFPFSVQVRDQTTDT